MLVFSDNGASAEGGKEGSVNEIRFTAHVRESMADNLAHYDDWGGFSTYNHYSWGWAWAGNTPHKLWKRYTWLGGTRTPLIVNWPGRSRARHGAHPVRARHRPHADRLGGRRARGPRRGRRRRPAAGRRRQPARELADPATAQQHHTQYFEMLGSRSIYHDGWKATTNHISTGSSTKRSSPSAAGASTRTAGSSSTSAPTSPRRTTAPRTSRSVRAT